jgi:hypothetical protein
MTKGSFNTEAHLHSVNYRKSNDRNSRRQTSVLGQEDLPGHTEPGLRGVAFHVVQGGTQPSGVFEQTDIAV